MKVLRPLTISAIIVIVLMFALADRLQILGRASAASPAPGGVEANLQLWLKADAGVTESGGNAITQWLDSAGKHTPTGGYYSDPDLLDSGRDLVNFNPVVEFDNNDYMRWEGDPFPSSFTAGELFIVGKEATPDTADHFSLFDFGGGGSQPRYTYSDRRIYDDFGSSDRKVWTPSNTAAPGAEGATGATVSGPNRLTTDYHIYNILSQTNNWQAAFDGVTALTDNTNTVSFYMEAVPHLGGAYGGYSNGGRVAEVVLFNRVLTASERQKINSYLALKYGLTLGVDYVDSAGNTLWNVTANSAHANDIAAIGIDVDSGLSQLTARSVNADSMVTITGTVVNISDGEFLLWGNDNAAQTTSTNLPVAAPGTTRMLRLWKVDETGDVGNVTISFDLSAFGGVNFNNPALFALLTDTDTDLSDATVTTGATVDGTTVTFSGVDFMDGQLFSLALPISAPGGVETNLQFWIKADASISAPTDNAVIGLGGWEDQVNAASVVQTANPTYQSDAASLINFNPTARFLNSHLRYDSNFGLVGTTDFAIFTILKSRSGGGTIIGPDPYTSNALHYLIWPDVQGIHRANVATVSTGVSGLSNGQTRLLGATRSGTAFQYYVDGANDGTVATNAISFASVPTMYIGARSGGHILQDSDISEVVVYLQALTPTQRQQVESYLAIKYGISLAGNYIASDGLTTLWNATTHAAYHNDVAGIGIDDKSGLSQLTSRSENADSLVTITGTVANIANGEFLFWGNDNGATTASTEVPSGYNQRLTREWKVAETGETGSVTITFDLTGVSGIDLTNAANFALLTDADGNFSDATAATGGVVNGNSVTFTGVNLNNGQFFSLAYPEPAAPGGIAASLQLWLKADAGTSTTTDGANVTTWTDQSANGYVLTSGNPDFTQNTAFNFHPAIDFNAEEILVPAPIGQIADGTNEFSFFTVFNTTNAARSGIFGPSNTDNAFELLVDYIGAMRLMRSNIADVLLSNKSMSNGVPRISTAMRAGNTFSFYAEGGLDVTATNAVSFPNSSGNGGRKLGVTRRNSSGSVDYFYGQIAEFIIYNNDLSASERQQIESYLALKYGITLTSTVDYLDSAGGILWDKSVNAAYYNDVAGIGIDAGSALTQTTSRSVNADGMVTITGTVASISSGEFLLWGNDDGAATFQGLGTVGPLPTANDRFGRIWKAQGTGDVGVVTVEFDSSEIQTGRTYCLLVDDDGVFTNGGTTEVGCVVASGPVGFSHDFDTASAPYFTLGLAHTSISGGVYDDTDGDGVKDAGEPGIGDVLISLSTGMTTTTDASGLYTFSIDLSGTYTIVETNPVGYISTGDTDGANDDSISVTVTAGQISTGNDFLDFLPRTGPCPQGALSALFATSGAQIVLDGECIYELSDGGDGYSFYDFWDKQDLVIDGQGATIERLDDAPDKGILGFFQSQNVTIKNLTIRGGNATTNYGLGGGLWFYRSTGRLENVRVVDNRANSGGGLQIEHPDSHVTIVNSVFANNMANDQGAAILAKGGLTLNHSTIFDAGANPSQGIVTWRSAEIRNSILSGFAIGLLSAGAETVVSEDHNAFSNNGSDMQDLSAGQFAHGGGSQSYDDLRFVDAAGGDFHLRFTSPAIDKGAATGDLLDGDGQPRPFPGGAVDVGVYEFQGAGGPALAIRRQNPIVAAANQPFIYRLLVLNEGVAPALDLTVLDTLPAGVSLVADSVSDGGLLVGGQIQWSLSSLAPGASKLLTYQAQAADTVLNSDYRVFSNQDPAVFAIGRPQTTVIGADLLASIAFAPIPDGYGFANYGGSQDDDLTVADMVTIFGADAVCKTQNPCVLTTPAATLRLVWLAALKSGHSEGMAATSLRHFVDPAFTPASLQPGALFANDLSLEHVRRWFALYASVQNLIPVNAEALAGAGMVPVSGSPTDVLDKLVANLSDATAADRYWIQISKSPEVRGGGWHSVVPYAVAQPSPDQTLIYVYDPNVPNQSAQAIQINRSTNRWSYVSAKAPDRTLYDYYGDATSANLRLISWQWQNSFPKTCTEICAGQAVESGQARAGAASDRLEFHLDGEGYFLVTRSDGLRAGFNLVNGSPILEISGAELLPVATGFGLNIPPGIRFPHQTGMTYAVEVTSRDTAYGNSEALANLNILGPDSLVRITDLKLAMPVVRVSRAGPLAAAEADQTETPFDSLKIGLMPDTNYISVDSTLRSQEVPGISMAINNPQGADFDVKLTGLDVAAGYSVALGFDRATATLRVENNDPADNSFSVTVERLNQTGVADQAAVTTSDDGSVGAVLALGSEWDGSQSPPLQPNTTPTLPQFYRILIPMLRTDWMQPIFFPMLRSE
ncbi:MAG: DUF11 domain-containing protein [Caldilineaceae bacterium]|nr:DUF11 domain-containing protein [Caldilineaceae bacterium]